MGKDFQKSALPTFLHFERVRPAHQPHVLHTIQINWESMSLALYPNLSDSDFPHFIVSLTEVPRLMRLISQPCVINKLIKPVQA